MLDRRKFLIASAAVAAAPRTVLAAPPVNTNIHVIDLANAPYFDRNKPPTGLDGLDACTRPNEKFLDKLRAHGVDTIIRYYSDRNNAGLNCKNITRRERDLLHEHGFSVGIVYQYRGRQRNRYTGSRAVSDAEIIQARIKAIIQPEGSTIYIGVDSDKDKNSDEGVKQYFRIINDVLGDRFEIGVYAAGSRCLLLKNTTYARKGGDGQKRSLATKFWVPEAPAWDGTRHFMNKEPWTFYQNKTEISKSLLAASMGQEVKLDTNIVNLPKDSTAPVTIGAFDADGTIKTYSKERVEAVCNARNWVTDSVAYIRDKPGGRKLTRVCIARTVHVLKREGDWALVDVDEDGEPEGYCRVKDLAPLTQMPQWRRRVCSSPGI